MRKTDLNGEWRLYISDGPREARREEELADITPLTALIPETLEATLERLGILPGLFVGDNVLKAQEYETKHLWYAKSFDYTSADGVPTLRFDGVDTVAEIFLNGVKLGGTDNAFIPHEFAAEGIREGENELLVHILPSVVLEAEAPSCWKYGLPNYRDGAVTLRKPPFTHGWDIFPRLMCGALFKDVSLVNKTPELIKSVYFFTKEVVWRKAVVRVEYETEEGGEVVVSGVCGRSAFRASAPAGVGGVDIDVPDPMLWAPKGMGKPNLYKVRIELVRGGEAVETRELSAGIRVAELDRTSVVDESGNGEFCVRINGNRMFCLGTNHVPVDAVLSWQKERLLKVLELLDDLNCNTVRVWGGGVYEEDEFYDYCDAHGIAVWQDFMMACAVYPETEEFKANLRREAEYQVRRLRNHPCLIIWAGDNEGDAMRREWYDEQLDPEDNALTRQVLPDVVERLDRSRVYIPSSPYFDRECVEKGTKYCPENHLWGPRDYYRSEFYHGALAKFVSEAGYFGSPSADYIRTFITPDALGDRYGSQWVTHSTDTWKTPDPTRNVKMNEQADRIFGKRSETLEQFAFASQVSQAEAIKHFIERFLAQKWRRTGFLWWNLCGGWPQFDDAAVDYNFDKRLVYHFIKRLQQPLCLLIDDEMTLRVINNTENESYAEYRVSDVGSGRTLTEGRIAVAYNSSIPVCKLPAAEKGEVYLLEWDYRSSGLTAERHGINHYLHGDPPFDPEKYASLMRKAGLIPEK